MKKDIAIKVEKLSKKYVIGEKNNYVTLREQLVKLPQKFIPKLRLKTTEFWALRGVSFEVKRGEVIGIIGRNGAGKSTLLKILSKIVEPTGGKITMRGKVASLLEVGTGFNPELTGRENIYLSSAIIGMTKKEINKKIDSIVEFSGIDKFIDTPVKRYSSGMYVRLAFAVSAHLDSDILLVDEVLAVGDLEFQKKCLGKMRSISSLGRTVIFISHSMSAISKLCDKCILIEDGKISMEGKTNDVIKKYASKITAQTIDYGKSPDKYKDIALLKVIVNQNAKKRSGKIPFNHQVNIQIEYEVYKKESNITTWISILDEEGVIAFTSCDYDSDKKLLGTKNPGSYKSEVTIPASMLNIGEYSVIVGIVKNNPLKIYEREETVNFSIYDNDTTPSSILGGANRSGLFQPILDWKTTKNE